jgi:hypothetical protein
MWAAASRQTGNRQRRLALYIKLDGARLPLPAPVAIEQVKDGKGKHRLL